MVKTTKRSRGKKSSRGVSKSVEKYVKKALTNAPEVQRKDAAYAKQELFHNVFYTPRDLFNASLLPDPSVGTEGFVGQKYRIKGYRIRMLCGQKNDRPNVTWRVSFIQVKDTVGKTYNNYFDNTTGNVLLDDLNDKYVKKLKEFWFKPNKGSMENHTDEFTFVKQFYVPFKRVINTDGATGYPRNHDPVYMMIHVYDAYGSLLTDNIAYNQTWVQVIYQDY